MPAKSPITCHVLDSSRGKPAGDVQVIIQQGQLHSHSDTYEFIELARGMTDGDGRCSSLLDSTILQAGVYKVIFKVDEYFKAKGDTCFFPFVEISFNLAGPGEHYHIPLLISPYSYTTYRGS
ncbi:hypothetical protein BU17DRAFT_39476 [Hysterangium stoloniferum]|nr:hypothetical protein BU17DRAFT_39476 [Hysterangium stoloniferum]